MEQGGWLMVRQVGFSMSMDGLKAEKPHGALHQDY